MNIYSNCVSMQIAASYFRASVNEQHSFIS